MKKLSKLHKYLQECRSYPADDYYIPARWLNVWDDVQAQPDIDGGVMVNPYQFYFNAVDGILNRKPCSMPSGIKSGVMFSMFTRTFTAWRHHDNGEICSGTFLKSIALLPYIKSMGVDMIYLLPVFKVSDAYKKGELGSPYSIKNIMEIEPSLADPLIPCMDAGEQFEAFCEAAHILGIRVMLDFVFRTCARDCDLILEHPDWFYWIKPDKCDGIKCPQIEGIGHTTVSPDNVEALYESRDMLSYASSFAKPVPCGVWKRELSGECDILRAAQERFDITVMPGFVDTINDPQPPWTDITYLKFYFDGTKNARGFASRNGINAPFIAQDGVKCSLFEGEQPNAELWDYIERVIPHYIDLGIDGARIDMGHALPGSLNKRIIEAARKKNPDFIFWSEEFSTANAGKAKKQGSDFITGDMWMLWKDKTACRRNPALLEAVQSELPVTAAAEMADTPRAAQTLGDVRHAAAAMITTAFLPNSVMLINNGQELCERQPMNLGLQNDEDGRYMLDRDHPLYGKLAFFDSYYFDWNSPDADYMYKAICKAVNIRKRYGYIIDMGKLREDLLDKRGAVQTIYYSDERAKLCVVINNASAPRPLSKILKRLPEQFDMGDCIYTLNCDSKSMKGGSAIIFVKED